MPKTTKDVEKEELNEKKSTAKKTTTTKKSTAKKSTDSTTKKTTKSTTKKVAEEKVNKSDAKKTTSTKKTDTKKITASTSKKSTKAVSKKDDTEKASKSDTKKTATPKKTDTKKSTASTTKKTTKSTTKKSTTVAKKKTSTTAKKKSTTTKTKKLEASIVAEYYDLPYRYNETVVKILYQTPTILFVYWDISDFDREQFINQYGENFFNNTKPILKIFNLTKGYDFEVEINDFANSWYINVNDANCEYKVELARRTINFEEKLNEEYIYISSSNDIEFPNDHILLESLPNKINFRNVKTNKITTKDISTMHIVGINKIYNANDFYKRFYKDEILEEINSNMIINPSSSSWN